MKIWLKGGLIGVIEGLIIGILIFLFISNAFGPSCSTGSSSICVPPTQNILIPIFMLAGLIFGFIIGSTIGFIFAKWRSRVKSLLIGAAEGLVVGAIIFLVLLPAFTPVCTIGSHNCGIFLPDILQPLLILLFGGMIFGVIIGSTVIFIISRPLHK